MSLQPLCCGACGGSVPLVESNATACPYCGAPVAIPHTHLAALAAQRQAAALRKEIEPRWRRMTAQAAWWLEWVAAFAILSLPPVLSLAAVFALPFPLAMVDGLVFIAIPSLLPGGLLWVWAIASRATAQRINRGLLAHPAPRPGGAPSCRACGAPLAVEPGSLASTCVYCGTDSIVAGTTARRVAAEKGAEIQTLKQALSTWRMRVTLLGAGMVALVVPAVALGALVWAAYRVAI